MSGGNLRWMRDFLGGDARNIFLDALTAGVPWPESRRMLFRAAPAECRAARGNGGRFMMTQPHFEAEKDSINTFPALEEVFENPDSYIRNPKSGVRVKDSRLAWYAAIEKSGPGGIFHLADLRDHKIKIIFLRQFWGAYHPNDYISDQGLEVFRYYERANKTLQRLKNVRWVKITAMQGRIRVHAFRDDAPQDEKIRRVAEKSVFHSSRPPDSDALDPDNWGDMPTYIRERMEFWRLEEAGGPPDELLDIAVRSEDETLAAWAVGALRKATDPAVVEQIRKIINGNSNAAAKAAIRAAGRLWLNDLESDVMRQLNRWESSIAPAVADYIGAVGITGRSFLPKILRSMARKGDFATLVRSIAAFSSFPRTFEAASLPEIMAMFLETAPDDPRPILEKFPGLEPDLFSSSDPRVPIHPYPFEVIRSAAVHAVIETTARTAPADVFDRAMRQVSVESPYLEKLLFEIEDAIRTEAGDYLMEMLRRAAETPPPAGAPEPPLSRRMVLIVRTLMRINKPGDRKQLILSALPLIARRVGVYRRDSEQKFNFHIENSADEPYIELSSILKGLPDAPEIASALQSSENFSDKEKYIVWEMTRDR